MGEEREQDERKRLCIFLEGFIFFSKMARESGRPGSKVVKYPNDQSHPKIRALTKLWLHTKTCNRETSKKIPQPGDVVCHAVQIATSHGNS